MSLPRHFPQPVPAVLFGGSENAVCAARSLIDRGVAVTTVAEDRSPAHRVRGVQAVRLGKKLSYSAATDFLAHHADSLDGHVLIPLSDPALEAVADNHAAATSRFVVTPMSPAIVKAMLDKETTNRLAREAGIAVPLQWEVETRDAFEAARDGVIYPLVAKPRSTYELLQREGRKFLFVNDEAELLSAIDSLADLPGGFVLNEFVPGGDGQLCSYYELRDEETTYLSFTKRVERRFAPNEGGATLHELVTIEDVAEAGHRFFEHVGLTGIGNVEFKRDPRTGELKLIECNHRITAATPLMQANGIDLVGAVYLQALGTPPTIRQQSGTGYMWYPVRDGRAALIDEHTDLRLWFSMLRKRPVLPYWRFSDPAPSLQHWANGVSQFVENRRTG